MATSFRTCPLCEACCGVELTDGPDGLRVRGDEHDVLSRGFICPKGTALERADNDPERLRLPLVRDRATGKRREVSWDEAFDCIERGLKPVLERGDPDALAFYYGTGAAHAAGSIYYQTLTTTLPTRNRYSSSTVDQAPKHIACARMFGHPMTIPIPDIDHCEYLLVLGANPLVSNGSLFTAPGMPDRFRALRKRGGRIVVVDPIKTRTAREADEHIALRPGTDALFLAAMVHVIFRENLAAMQRLEPHVLGVDIVRGAVQPFSPERVAAKCGVSAETIMRQARDLAAASRAAVYGRIGTTCQEFGTTTSWLVDVLNIVTGNLDRRGGAMFPKAAVAQANSQVRAARKGHAAWGPPTRVRGLPSVDLLGGFERPAICLAEEIETPGNGQIRAFITMGCNPVLSVPDGPRLARALEKLDFMVSFDPYLNETTRYADVVLPSPGDLAKFHYPVAMMQWATRNVAKWSGRSRPLHPDERCDQEILLRLINIVSGRGAKADIDELDDRIFDGSIRRLVRTAGAEFEGGDENEIRRAFDGRRGVERMIDLQLRTGPYGDKLGRIPDGLSLARLEASPHGVDLGPLQPRLPEVLRTPSQKIEMAPGEFVADLDRLAAFMARPAEGLVLIGRRDLRSHNSWLHNIDDLMRGKPRCTLQINPADAKSRQLADGSKAILSSALSSIEVDVEVTETVMPGVVSLPHGWGHVDGDTGLTRARQSPGVNGNVIISTGLFDPLSGNAALNGVAVRVAPLAIAPAGPESHRVLAN